MNKKTTPWNPPNSIIVADGMSSAVEASMYNSIQAILRQAASSCNKGMLRWTLHKKVETHPSNSVSLVRVLVKELEKVERLDYKMHVIPLLHTLNYVIIQSSHIPCNLFQRVYECFKRLLTLPEPYCTITLRYMRSIKMEQITPGALYQRRVIAEQSLRNKRFPQQERVFVFADPAVFSGSLWQAVRADLVLAGPQSDTLARRVLLHTLQAGLGKACHGPILTQALEDLGEDVEKYFQEVVLAVEQSIENGEAGRDQHKTRLQHIYSDILTSANQDPKACGSLSNTPLPSPEIHFHLWTNEEELWNELVNFTLNVSTSERNSMYQEEEEEDVSKRVSLLSVDSGIEKDLSDMEEREQRNPFTRSRSPCFRGRMKPEDKMALVQENIKGPTCSTPLPKEEGNLTARIVMMGDDRVLGRLAKAYHSIRKREAKHLILTKRVNLQIYYIPVTDEPIVNSPESTSQVGDRLSLASFLGRVDPWYESNINSLGSMIPKLAGTSRHSRSSEPNHFLVDVLSYYLRCGLQPVHFTLYSVKISVSGQTGSPVNEVFVSHLDAEFPEFKTLRENLKQERSSLRRTRKTHGTCGAVVSMNYTKVSLSKQEVVQGMSVMTCGVVISAISPNETEGLDSLTVHFDSTNPRCCTEIRTQNIKIRILEDKTFTVCLDKDCRRKYTHVQSIEISPCLDPGYCLQTSSKFSVGEEREAGLSKYMCKILPLPINTFTGINH
ncbi:phosphoinositide 3-kinase regulatory subunit 6 isoform X2 [Oncorhynchus tshawytscha]|uniref:phosphoinositide 3-kinase regulatory subunit 6 isoform X2 n=1 Tax=Oncorhynchus tshawytscha TaxID=74940 RepID=UPI000D0980FD|nr:phosphoinositide 3-kinase regulatory subunit 6 isoform X2 [Oncorhynchus tshawytscha]